MEEEVSDSLIGLLLGYAQSHNAKVSNVRQNVHL